MRARFSAVAVGVLGVALAAAGCGSTGNVGSGSGGGSGSSASTTAAGPGFGSANAKLCSGTAGTQPNYKDTVGTVAGGAKTISGAGSTFAAPLYSTWASAYSKEQDPSRPPALRDIQPATIGHLRLLRVKSVGIDLDGRRVFVGSTEVQLAPKEFDLLRMLLENAGRILTRRELLDACWCEGHADVNKTLETHIRRLRRKLDSKSGPSVIRTVRGSGYIFDIDADQLTGAP